MPNNNVSNSEQFSPEELIKRLKSQLNLNTEAQTNNHIDGAPENNSVGDEASLTSNDPTKEDNGILTVAESDAASSSEFDTLNTGETIEPVGYEKGTDSSVDSDDINTNEELSLDNNTDDSEISFDDLSSDFNVSEEEKPTIEQGNSHEVDFLAFLSQETRVSTVEDDRAVDNGNSHEADPSENISDFLGAISVNDLPSFDNNSAVLPEEKDEFVDTTDSLVELNDSDDGSDVSSFVNADESSDADFPVQSLDSNSVSHVETEKSDSFETDIVTDLTSQAIQSENEEDDYELDSQDAEVETSADPHKPTPDYNMLIALGIPVSEVEKIYGAEAASEYTKLTDSADYIAVHEEDTDHYEYSSRAQNTEINEYYRKEKVISFTKLCCAGVLLLIALLFENLPVFGVEINGWLSQLKYPVVHVMIDLQLVLIAASIALDEIISGFRSILAKAPNIGSVLLVSLVVNVTASMILCFSGEAMSTVRLTGSTFVFMSFICILSSFVKLRVESNNFEVISGKGTKCCAFTSSPDDAKERIAFFEKTNDEEVDNAKIISFGKTGFVSGFFRRHNSENVTVVDKVLIPAALVVVVASAVISYVTHHDLISVYGAISASASFVFPVCIFTAGVLTYAKASKYAESMKAAIVGQVSPFEFAGASVVSFDDRDAYPAYCVKLRNLKVYGKIAILDVLRATSAVFRIVGGPLNDVLENATAELEKNVPASVTRFCDSGIEAEYNGNRVLIGKGDFLHSYGIIPYSDVDDREYLKSGDVSIMYVAVNNELSAKFYVQYTLDVDFEVLLRDLNRAGICVSIRTSDPNIDNRLLQSKLNLNKTALKIVYREPDAERSSVVAEADCGVVGTGTPSELVHTIMLCDRTAQVIKANNIIKAASLLVGTVLLMVLTLISGGLNISSAVLMLYQLFWMLPTLIVSKLFL